MLILLPPSERKTPAPAGAKPVDLGALSRPALLESRQVVMTALRQASARPNALDVLGVGASLQPEIDRNTRLEREPATDMARVYSGVLFAALGLHGLSATAGRRARTSVVVISALWGALSPGDRIPAYRLAMGTHLPGVGPLAAHWRAPLQATLAAGVAGAVMDCRSAPYVAAWRPRGDAAELVVAVRVLSGDTVISHHTKHTRGQLAHHLLSRPARLPRTPAQIAEAAAERYDVELIRSGPGWRLDVRTD